jgi:hypothetical protein
MNSYKNQLVDQYILPFFEQASFSIDGLKKDFYDLSNLHQVVAKQLLESPGGYEQGQMWFGVSSLVHSYYYCQDNREDRGRQIWKKQEFILDTASLLGKEQRSDYIQALEPGAFISIRYIDLLWLMERYPAVRLKTEELAHFQQRYYHQHIQLLNKPTLERVRQLQKAHPLFCNVASNTVKAMHVALTRQGYESQLKKLDEEDQRNEHNAI